jgi:hypothetical protein
MEGIIMASTSRVKVTITEEFASILPPTVNEQLLSHGGITKQTSNLPKGIVCIYYGVPSIPARKLISEWEMYLWWKRGGQKEKYTFGSSWNY